MQNVYPLFRHLQPIALTERFSAELFAGKLATATSLAAELATVTEA
jgi:hypothetical protein